jgi:hypothetical protein
MFFIMAFESLLNKTVNSGTNEINPRRLLTRNNILIQLKFQVLSCNKNALTGQIYFCMKIIIFITALLKLLRRDAY